MRKAILVLLSCSILAQLIAQPSNDNCSTAQTLQLKTPSPCPEGSQVADVFHSSNAGATASAPFPALSGCNGGAPQSAADVWFRFAPAGNDLAITIGQGLENPFLALFAGGAEGCPEMYPIACASGNGSLELSAFVDPSQTYYLLVSGGSPEDQGEFELTIRTANQCNMCLEERQGYFTSSPAPANGAFASGQTVQMCYVVKRWHAITLGENLHGLELHLGPGWDPASFLPNPPLSCSGEGTWGYYREWTSSSTGQIYGPGFAFDGPVEDGNPGNNLGMGGGNCANIGINAPELAFCWTVTAAECAPGDYGIQNDLGLSVRMLGDGQSGAGQGTSCSEERRDNFLAALYCPDPFEPEVIAIDGSCGDNCDGALLIAGGGQGPWDYAVTDNNGNVYYSSANSTGTDTVPDLCPGLYNINVFSIPEGENRVVAATVGAAVVPQASATYKLPCFEGEPIELYGQADPSAGASYSWTGPNGFSSSSQNPLALYSGIYTLVVSANGCASAPFELDVPPVGEAVVTIAEDTITACPGEDIALAAGGNATSFTWYANNSDEPVGSGPSITVTPEDGAIYRVTGFNDNGCGGFDEVAISIPFDPALSADTSGTLCPGTTLTLTASEGEQFLWSTGDTTASITVSPAQSTQYHLDVTGPNGCAVQLSAFVQVASSAGIFISPSTAICEGETASLFAAGGDISWSTGDSVSTLSVSPLQTTTYSATITNSLGCEFVRESTVTVSPVPAIVLVPADTATLCQGESLQLLAYESDTLIWDSLVAPAQSRDYILPGASAYGCREIGRFTVIVNPLPDLSIDGQSLLCSSDSMLLVANSNGALAWSTGESNDSIYVLPAGTETYSVTATDANGCSRADSVQVTRATPPEAPQVSCSSSLGQVVFSWVVEPGLTYGLAHLQGPAGTPIGNNRYAVSGLLPGQAVSIELEATNAAGCTAITPASCSAPDCSVLNLFIGGPNRLCSSDGPAALTALVTGGSGNGTGGWAGPGVDDASDSFYPGLAGPGVHDVAYTYTDAGCTISDTLQITVEQALEAALVSCSATPGTVTFSWPALPSYTGYLATALTGQSGEFLTPTTYQVAGLRNGEEVIVEITALGGGACGETTVLSSCTAAGCPALEAIADTMICSNSNLRFSVDPTGWGTFEWSPAAGLSCADCPDPEVFPSATTTYTLIATDDSGCADTLKTTVYVDEIPDQYVPDGPIYFCEGEPFELCLPEAASRFWIGPNAFVSTETCLRFDNPTAAIAGPYLAYLRTADCRFTKRFELKPAPPIEILEISDFQAVCPDEPFRLYVEALNAATYSWNPADYLDCPTCPVTEGRVPQTATFTVEITDSYGCTATETAVVFVDNCQSRPGLPPAAPAEAEALRFYPNPAGNSVQLELPGEGFKAVQLWSSSGVLIRELRTAEQSFTLPLPSVPDGAYLLRMVAEKEVRTGWLLVRK